MSALNPQFGHVDDAAFRIPCLLRKLNHVSVNDVLDQDRLDMVDAIAQHTNNVNELILDGLQSVGELMSLASAGEFTLGTMHIMQLGTLIKHMANEANFMRATHNDMRHILSEQAAKGKA